MSVTKPETKLTREENIPLGKASVCPFPLVRCLQDTFGLLALFTVHRSRENNLDRGPLWLPGASQASMGDKHLVLDKLPSNKGCSGNDLPRTPFLSQVVGGLSLISQYRMC